MDGKSVLNNNLKHLRLEVDQRAGVECDISIKYKKACGERDRAQYLVEKYAVQLHEQNKEVKKVEELVKEEETARRKLNRLLKKHDGLHMEEYTDYSVQVWLGDWEEDMPYQDTWEEAYSHAKWLLKQF
jgi:hypothetical protein